MQEHSRKSPSACTKQIDAPRQGGTLADPQRHDELLNYRLKRLVTSGGAPAIRLCEGRFGIARLEWRLLAALVEEGARSPSELTRRTGLDAGRVSRTLTLLTEKQLVTREPVHERKRRARVEASESGRELYDSLWPLLAAINRRLVSVLEPHESKMFDRCLVKLTEQALRIQSEGALDDLKTHRRLGGSRRVWKASGAGPTLGRIPSSTAGR